MRRSSGKLMPLLVMCSFGEATLSDASGMPYYESMIALSAIVATSASGNMLSHVNRHLQGH